MAIKFYDRGDFVNIELTHGIVNYLLSHSSIQNRAYPEHAHEDYSISLVLKGTHRLVVGEEVYEVKAGMIRVLHPSEMHAIELSSWEQINISVEASSMESQARSTGKDASLYFDTIICDERLKQIILNIEEANQKESRAESNERVQMLLTYMIDKYAFEIKPIADICSVKPEIQKALAYIDEHAHRCDLTLDEVAGIAYMSKYHFLRLFKQAYGRTPNQYLQNIRIDCIRKKLAEQVSLADAAVECGFYDQSHMIKTYKKYYGHTPSRAHPKKSNILL